MMLPKAPTDGCCTLGYSPLSRRQSWPIQSLPGSPPPCSRDRPSSGAVNQTVGREDAPPPTQGHRPGGAARHFRYQDPPDRL